LIIDFKNLSGFENLSGLSDLNRHDNITGLNDLNSLSGLNGLNSLNSLISSKQLLRMMLSGIKMTYSGLSMWNELSKIHYFMEFWHSFRTEAVEDRDCIFNQIQARSNSR
jgi:hypothetical protein